MPTHPLIEVHEDRIARLEERVGDCRVDLGVLKEKTESLEKTLAAGIDMLAQKIDATNHVKDRVAAIEQHHEVEAEVRQRTRDRRVRVFKVGAALASIFGVFAGLLLKLLGD